MQNVATEKSSVAALPHKLELDISQPQSGSNELFRSLFQEAQPTYRQPVEPKAREVQRQEHSSNPSARATDTEQRASDQRAENRSHSTGNSAAEKPAHDTQNEHKGDSVVSEHSAQTRNEETQKASASSSNKEAEKSDYEQSNKVTDQEGEKIAADTQTSQTEKDASDLDKPRIEAETQHQESSEINLSDGQKESSQEVDWLALLEGLRAVELGSKSKQDKGTPVNSTETSIEALIAQAKAEGTLASESIEIDKEQLRKLLESVEAVMAKLPRESAEASEAQAIQLALNLSALQGAVETDQEMPLLAPKLELEGTSENPGANTIETDGEAQLLELQGALEALFAALNGKQQDEQSLTEAPEQFELTQIVSDINPELETSDATTVEIPDVTVQQSISEKPAADLIEPLDLALVAALLQKSVNDGKAPTNSKAQDGKVNEQIQALLQLNDSQLNFALNNLAERSLKLSEQASTVDEAQLTNIATLGVAKDGVKNDFVASLKAGLEEIKAQLKQGHVSAIDLKALVAQSLEVLQQPQPSAESLSQMTGQFSAALDLSSQLGQQGHSATLVAALDKIAMKDSAQTASQQVKQMQQHMGQFDKAVNITRAEGHQQFVEKVRWMVNQNQLQADIRLDPPDLGSMKVRVNLSGDSASVSIVVQSQQAKEVLEQATPRLKELLEEQGIALGQSSVEQEQHQQQQQGTGAMASSARAGQDSDELEENQSTIVEQPIRNGRIGGIDYFV